VFFLSISVGVVWNFDRVCVGCLESVLCLRMHL